MELNIKIDYNKDIYKLVEKITNKDKDNNSCIKDVKTIDEYFYEIYNLTRKEIDIIERNI